MQIELYAQIQNAGAHSLSFSQYTHVGCCLAASEFYALFHSPLTRYKRNSYPAT